ncbi:YraN family protein [Patescibacteria group bacterium]|nr:YraN family protein [Patescibacteria group bacterium]
MKSQKTAKIGEKLACKHLVKNQYYIIETNVRFREGEIDIIARKENQLIFVEVKTRTNWKFGYPEEAFDNRKRQRLEAAINRYLLKADYEGDWQADLIAIDLNGHKAELRHYKSIELT